MRSTRSSTLALLLALLALLSTGTVLAQQGPDDGLDWGEFTWHPERAPEGPIVVVVSLTDQRAYVYRNGIRIGIATVSSGKPGYETPTGVFVILQKDADHVSSIYHAKMPYTQRLTWGGIALHAGGIPGYPESHGCVHLPLEFSKQLFEITSKENTTVVITEEHADASHATHPGLLLGAGFDDGLVGDLEGLPVIGFRWEPERSPEGHVSILFSGADRRVYVYRHGVLIAEGVIQIDRPEEPLIPGSFALVEFIDGPNDWMPGKPTPRWLEVGLHHEGGQTFATDGHERVRMHPRLAERIYEILHPGATLMITPQPATTETTTEADFVVLGGPHPEEVEAGP